MTTPEHLEAYRQAAIRHAAALKQGKSRVANKAFDELVRLSHHFRRGDLPARQAFMMLLDDVDPAVRLPAAIHTLELDPDRAVRVLRTLAAGPPSVTRLQAEMALTNWEAGTLLPLP